MNEPFSDRNLRQPIQYLGIDVARLERWRLTGLDDSNLPIHPFTDEEGGWALRCCLRDSRAGDRIAILAASPFPWHSPYATRGPIVIHADACPGSDGTYPTQFDGRDQIIRAYGTDEGREHTLVYDLNQMVTAGDDLPGKIAAVLSDDRVEFVQSHNVRAGCYSFTARRLQSIRQA